MQPANALAPSRRCGRRLEPSRGRNTDREILSIGVGVGIYHGNATLGARLTQRTICLLAYHQYRQAQLRRQRAHLIGGRGGIR